MPELAIGDGCGLKPGIEEVENISAFNNGGQHPSRLGAITVGTIRRLGMKIADFEKHVTESNILQPGLDAGHHWIEKAGVFSVATTDYMTPPTDKPEVFGSIAALHVMSDLWVSGVSTEDDVTMQQILVVPSRGNAQITKRIKQGFKEICEQFKISMTGGQTRRDGSQYMIGGTATGYIEKRYDLSQPQAGDIIVATKALGTSLAIAAHKKLQHNDPDGLPDTVNQAIRAAEVSMLTSNYVAVAMRQERLVRSCTDITGFGLMGHLSNLLKPVGLGAVIELNRLPILDGAIDLAEAGLHTQAGDHAQYMYADQCGNVSLLGNPRYHLAFHPETSGGVLATMNAVHYPQLEEVVNKAGQTLTIIGEVTSGGSENNAYRYAGIRLC